MPEGRTYGSFIGRDFAPIDEAHVLDVIDKYHGVRVGRVGEASEAAVDMAVAAAVEAHRAGAPAPRVTSALLTATAAGLRERAEELARTLVAEVGKTLREARAEVANAISAADVAAGEAVRITGETIPVDAAPGMEGAIAFTLATPAGPVAAITPYNSPLNTVTHKVASALAAGCPVVVKPSELAPLTTLMLAEVMRDAGIGPGWLGVLCGGPEVGERLCRDPRVTRITFTGGPRAARAVLAAADLRPVTLELGPASPTFVHADGEVDRAVSRVLIAAFAIAGQVCTSVQRLFLHRSIADEFMERFVPSVEALRVGDPHLETTDVGPMISEGAAERAEAAVRGAAARGARIRTGGGRRGSLMWPTVLEDVVLDDPLFKHEAFAPIVCITRYGDLDEAIDLSNTLTGGLQAGIFTRDLGIAIRFARRMRAGGIIVNDTSRFRVAPMPFGGVGDAGYGREGPRYAIKELSDEKTVVILP